MILPKMLSFIEKNHMLDKCKTLILGVSGGADSVCLLLLMEEIGRMRGISLVVVHIEHGIRGKDSIEDAGFVENLCNKKKIPFVCYSFEVEKIAKEHGESTEEAGRRLRYETFEKVAAQYEDAKIAVAHNENDNAETMLLNLARGTGLKGLCGIPPVRGKIIRPLLCVSRGEIETYLKEKGQEYRTDGTNLLDIYARNRIRHDVVPAMESINEKAVSHMKQTADMVVDALDFIELETAEAMKSCVEENRTECEFTVKQKEFLAYPVFLQKQILYQVFAKAAGSRKDITKDHIDRIASLFEKQVGRRISLPYQCSAYRVYEGVCIGKQKPEKAEINGEINPQDFSFRILDNSLKIGEIPKNKYTKWFDYDKIKFGLQIRTRQEGDFFILDGTGQEKKLKSYFINEKIPRGRRDRIPLLAEGSHILWIVGYRISAYYKVTEKTKKILEVHYHGGKE